MHNNFFFLSKLSTSLNTRLKGFVFGEIFSQNKDELIIGLYQDKEDFYIKAHLSSQFSCLSFPKDFHRAKKNSVNLFEDLIGKEIHEIRVANHDRSLIFHMNGYSFVFKLYGNRSNILIFDDNECIDIFKQKFEQDKEIKFNELDKKPDLSFESFQEKEYSVKKFIPTLGKDAVKYFEILTSSISDQKLKWEKLITFIDQLPNNKVYLIQEDQLPQLLMFPHEKATEQYDDPIKALNNFFIEYVRIFSLENKKKSLIGQKKKQLKKAESYLKKSKAKLEELVNARSYSQIADIIMANLHQIQIGNSEVELFDFYQNKNVKINLNKTLSPQKNAENYYRKSKNQKIEVEKLKENITRKETERAGLLSDIEKINNTEEYKELKTAESPEEKSTGKNLIYHKLRIEGYDILVGKNAKRNDELTFKVANKNDLWLHVKDAAGSHVIIRQVPGKNPGENVLQKAASLAAYFSKRKTEAMVPVSYTERKYVRKTKHLLAGQVIVEKEKVILAEPFNWLENG